MLVLETLSIPPFDENTYLVGDARTGQAIAIDPGGRCDDLLRLAAHHGVVIGQIVNTHAHIDHVLGVAELQARSGATFHLHSDAAATLAGVPTQARAFGLPEPELPRVDGTLDAGDTVRVGALTLSVRYTPGHAPGHLTFVGRDLPHGDATITAAWCGDVIFHGSIGRTDLPGGDFDVLMTSIGTEILTLPDDTILLSGHGPATTVAAERRSNPFVRQWLAAQGANA